MAQRTSPPLTFIPRMMGKSHCKMPGLWSTTFGHTSWLPDLQFGPLHDRPLGLTATVSPMVEVS